MSADDHVYKLIEVVGTSTTTLEEAIQNGITRAGKTVRKLRWFQVVETRGNVKDGQVDHWQVTLKIGFTLDEEG